MASKKEKSPPSKSEIVTPTYRGSNRRDPDADEDNVEAVSSVGFDAKGNSVWQTRVDAPRRRKDDDTINLLKHLDLDSLSLQDEDSLQEEESAKPSDGYNPYSRDDE